MSHWADSGKAKARRAKFLVQTFEADVRNFFHEGAYDKVREDDPRTGGVLWRLRWLREPPVLEWGACAGDVIHNLRSALDNVWCQILEVHCRRPASKRDAFPMYPSERDWRANQLREIGKWSQAAVDIIKASKPYQGQPLYALGELDDRNKHRVLTTIAVGIPGTSLLIGPEDAKAMFPAAPEDKIKYLMSVTHTLADFFPNSDGLVREGTVIFRLPAHFRGKEHLDPQPGFDIALDEPTILSRRPLFPLLREFTHSVDTIIDGLAAIS